MPYGRSMAPEETPAKSTKSGRPLGPSGDAVRSNIKRIRENQRIPVTELSARMQGLDRPIPPLGIHRIEDGQRRVDVDDLVAFAVALGVSPASLLMPDVESIEDQVVVTGSPEPLVAGRAWAWIGGQLPISEEAPLTTFIATAWPLWRWRQVSSAVNEALTERQKSIPDEDSYVEIHYHRPSEAEPIAREDSDGDD